MTRGRLGAIDDDGRELIIRLFFTDGMTVADTAREAGHRLRTEITKNQVSGIIDRARRQRPDLNEMRPRVSWVRPAGSGQKPRAVRHRSVNRPRPERDPVPPREARMPRARVTGPEPAVARKPVHARPGRTCQWIAGEPTADAVMCGAPGFPWCAEHRAIVFQARRVETWLPNSRAESADDLPGAA